MMNVFRRGRTLCARLQKCINLPEIWKNGGFDRRGCRDSCLPPEAQGAASCIQTLKGLMFVAWRTIPLRQSLSRFAYVRLRMRRHVPSIIQKAAEGSKSRLRLL